MDVRVIRMGMEIKIAFKYGAKWYGVSTKVADVLDNECAIMADILKRQDGKLVLFPKGDIKIICPLSDGRSVTYKVSDYTVDMKTGKYYKFLLEEDGKVENRRDNVRIKVEMPYEVILTETKEIFTGITKDISNGGIALLVTKDEGEKFLDGIAIKGVFKYGEKENEQKYVFSGTVARSFYDSIERKTVIGVQFDREYEEIRSLIITIQREQLRKKRK